MGAPAGSGPEVRIRGRAVISESNQWIGLGVIDVHIVRGQDIRRECPRGTASRRNCLRRWCRRRRRLYELVVEDGVPTARRVRSIARCRTGPDPRADDFALLIVDRRSGIGVWIEQHRGGLRARLLPWSAEWRARGRERETR